MLGKHSKDGIVLQGYFRIEQFRGGAAQAKADDFWRGRAPRPELMSPQVARGGAAQAKQASSRWPGAPRPELLPGMIKPAGVFGRAAQLRGQGGVVSSPLPDGRLRLIGPGKPLEPEIRAHMESFFDADFSGVRVHEGPAAQAMGALAFTLGETLYFAPGLYDTSTREGIELLGHELTHVVQQRDGRVSNPHGRGVAIVQDPALEAEADAMGRRIVEELWTGGSHASALALQRSTKHKTKKGNVKESTIDFLKNDKFLDAKKVVDIWETVHRLFDKFAGDDSDGLPANTTGNLPKVIDLTQLTISYYSLGKVLSDGIGPALQSSRGDHDNDEGKLPTYVGPTPYEEYGYLKSGARLVVDHTSGRRYISLHYSTFYRVI